MKIRYIRNYLNGNTKNVSSHWIEIEAYTDDGTNVALNKSVTSNFTPESGTSLSYITNGNKATKQYVCNVGGGNVYATIDLGNIFDVKMVKMIHFYEDNRKYHDNILQVSKDGINYITMFDSNIEGEYSETSTGKDVVIRNIPEIEILNQTINDINFSVTCDGVINKVEVLVNGVVSETYTDNFDNLTYNIDNSLCSIGNNKITIRVTYDDNYIEELSLTHTVTVNNLPTTSSLKDVIDRQELLNNSIEIQKNNLKNILVGKNVEVLEEDKMSDLIGKVDLLGEYDNPILWLYKFGNEYVDVTGGWVFRDTWEAGGIFKEGIKNSDNLQVNMTYDCVGFIADTIDFTNYSKLKIDYEITKNTDKSSLRVIVKDAYPYNSSNLAMGTTSDIKRDILEINVSSVTGVHKLSCESYTGTTASGQLSFKIYQIWLEK